ncbi:DegT/DnrJ/EryC1/StrS family aminotransferase [Nafulsella turpanensis]|uniref:DegT/DnrJ/EryC1/StrS family aminotransferase n=1 Tax=Nafulsella turpanensis TaxID=1265690 RepID=UPI0003460DBB|nr:DegT/DnrJ/EryC1/StrS family aminotransferase [Nafulsella turpanensis]
MIPFSPPHIGESTLSLIKETLESGWITTGPKTKLLEQKVAAYCGSKTTYCVNSATAGLELVLRWFGVGPGDEVILPAYTYCATANVVEHCGATPVLVDIDPKTFNISVSEVEKAINSRTKVIMPVDFAGFPCDYNALNSLVKRAEVKSQFSAATEIQEKLGRILILSDAAHSFGGKLGGKLCGSLTDISVFSFHAVKNFTTAEGGAIAFNLPEEFNPQEVYQYFNTFALHGQNKDALAKTQKGNWRYDVLMPGYKCNMTDLLACIGLAQIDHYESEDLAKRKEIFSYYTQSLVGCSWAEIPTFKEQERESSYHLYPLRLKGVSEETRDRIIQSIFDKDVAVNVHFIPLPMLSYYKKAFDIIDFPVAYDSYSREISLPVYYNLTPDQQSKVIQAVIDSVEENI